MYPLSIVIPAYNEEKRLQKTVEEIHRYLTQRRYDFEIIVVDDGSVDKTVTVAQGLARQFPNLRILGDAVNRGKGFAVKVGVLAATHLIILFSDADLSTPIGEIEKFWHYLDEGFPILIGSRALSHSQLEVRQPWYRENMGKIFNMILSFMGFRGIHDTQCGFKLFTREVAQSLFRSLETSGFAFDVEILWKARRRGYRICEVPVRWVNSSDSRVHPLRDSLKMLLDIVRIRFQH